MRKRDGYPAGVPCWLDIIHPDFDASMAFYGGLFSWDFEVRTPPGAPVAYAYARKEGLLVAGVGGGDGPDGWITYVWADSVDETVAAVIAAGGRTVSAPVDIPRAGRVAVCADPAGALFGMWQAAEHRGAELVNEDGAWNFSDLTTPDHAQAQEFYGTVFGWECDPFEISEGDKASIWRLPGYGEFLAAGDPEIRARQEAAQAPGGFADAVAILNPVADGGSPAQWGVTFAVADADGAFARALALGAEVVTPLFDTMYTRMGTVQDPQGGVLTLSEYRPPA